jgi:inner membrane transporter RhtA
VGVCSSVIPYVTDQLAMARLPRATFSLMLALLPATATVIGLSVLGQVPTMRDLTGIGLVILGVALHRDTPRREDQSAGDRDGGRAGAESKPGDGSEFRLAATACGGAGTR